MFVEGNMLAGACFYRTTALGTPLIRVVKARRKTVPRLSFAWADFADSASMR